MSEGWRAEPPSIWSTPAKVGLAFGLVSATLAAIASPPGLAGFDMLAVLVGRLVAWFVIGFFVAVFLLTYVRVSEPRA